MAFLAPLLGEGLVATEGAGAAAGGAAAEDEVGSSNLLSNLSGNKGKRNGESQTPSIKPLTEDQLSAAVSRSENFEIGRRN